MSQELTVIGLMSGTSLDGLDVCCVRFSRSEKVYHYEIIQAETFKYDDSWKDTIEECFDYKVTDPRFERADKQYGQYIGKLVQLFILKHGLKDKVDLIASHGHTIFHEPNKGITVQIGSGDEIARATGIDVINDFRIKDVELGGQGAPLVPIGDRLLFNEYESCLNLGGIANISFEFEGNRVAFDICPANIPLNYEIKKAFHIDFDRYGEMASTGTVIEDLLATLNALPYYRQRFPKSLGMEWITENILTHLTHYEDRPTAHLLRTLVEHETDQIDRIFNRYDIKNCLVTGGGAYNTFFMERLLAKTECEIIIPEPQLVEFKEALIFAFLAYLNVNDQINTLASVTGANSDSIGGIKHLAKQS